MAECPEGVCITSSRAVCAPKCTPAECMAMNGYRPRTVVITGATSGIGEVAALRLAEHGARVIFVARDPARSDALLKRLRAMNPHGAHSGHLADLSRIEAMRRVGDEIAAHASRIDVLINNAGAIFMGPTRSVDGLAASFATNHLAYYVVTLRLLERLHATPGARIICTASRAHRFARKAHALSYIWQRRSRWPKSQDCTSPIARRSSRQPRRAATRMQSVSGSSRRG